MNYKPFDLQKALAGEPVVTEGDTGHYQFTLAGNSRSTEHRHVFKMSSHEDSKHEPHEYIIISDDFGDVISGYTGQEFDPLFMAPQKKTVWLNVWRSDGEIKSSFLPFQSKEIALQHIDPNEPTYIGTYPIEIEL